MPDPEVSWRRNQFAVTVATFIGFAGFTLVMPFLPLYFQHLGVTDIGAIALWSGLSLGVTPGMTALFAPLWGRLADRFGGKIMVERSLGSFVVVMAATAFVTEPWHVLALRVVQGFFAGYGALALAMAAESAPPGRLASAIGSVQTAQRLGPALGPIMGGTIAQLVGLRQAFLVAAAVYLAAFLLVLVLYREPARVRPAGRPAPPGVRGLLGVRLFVLLMGIVFLVQFADRSIGPVLPLFVAELGTLPGRVPLMAGAVFSIVAGTGALGHHVGARLLRRVTAGRVLAGGAAGGAAASVIFAAAPAPGVLLIAAPVFGLAIGMGLTAAYTAAGSLMPAGAQGRGFGLLSSASLAGLAISPVASGLLGGVSIRAVFVLDALILAALALVAARCLTGAAPEPAAPAREDA